MKSEFELWQKCECSHEMISYEYDPETKLIYCMLYNHICPDNPTFKDRLKTAWHILFGSHISCNDIVLTKDQAQELEAYFHKINHKINENEKARQTQTEL